MAAPGHLPPDALAHSGIHWRRRDGGWIPAPPSEDDDDKHQSGTEPDERHHPDEEVEPFFGWREQDPFPVSLDEVLANLLGSLAGGQALADDLAHLVRRLRGRVGHREGLTDHAAELGRQLVDDALIYRRGGRRRRAQHRRERERGEG